MGVTISLLLPEDDAHLSLIRQVGRALLKHHGAAPQDIDDMETVVGELCANVTRHARSEAGAFRVALEHEADRVVVTVTDQGRGFDPAQVAPVGTDRGGRDGLARHGGYGLPLVIALADRVEFQAAQPCGMIVRAEKKIQSGGAGAAESPAPRVR